MKMKKFKLIVLSSLVLSTLAQPVGVLATTEINNTSKVQTKGASTKAIANPNLVNISSKSVVSGYTAILGNPNRWKSVNWDQSSDFYSVKGNKVGFTSLESVAGGLKFGMSDMNLTVVDNQKVTIQTGDKYTIGQAFKTEIGKEYTISTDYILDQSQSELWLTIDGGGVKSNNSADGNLNFNFVAKSTSTYLAIQLIVMQTLGKPKYGATLTSLKAVKSSSQVAIEELQQLLPTFFDKDGNLGSKITATDLAKAQAFLNKVSAGTEKTKLQVTFNKATELLNQRNALAIVTALFEGDDVTSDEIKETVTQASVDSAKNAINKVTNTTKKAELMTYLARAQEFLNQNQAASAVSSLFVDNDPQNDIKDNVTYLMITAASILVEKVTDDERKAGLQEGAKKAKDLLDARIEEENNQKAAETSINSMFKENNPASGAIVDGLVQETIEEATVLANKVKDETKKASLLDSIAIVQELLNERLTEEDKVASIREAISNLFQDNNPSASIREDLTQGEIDTVVSLVETIKDSIIQSELNSQIANAQTGLNALNSEKEDSAEAAVNGLFQNNDPATGAIKGGLTQEMINKATALTSQVLDADKKAEYQANIVLAQSLLDERIAEANRQEKATEAVNALFVTNNPASGEIIVGLTQDAINSAQALIDVVTATSKKEALQKIVANAQNLLTSRIEEENRQELATTAVNALFEDNDPATGKIAVNLTKELIDAAEALAEKVTNTSVKAALLGHINVAEVLLEERIIENSLIAAAQKEVNGLFQNNDPKAGIIIEGLTQTHIDAAKVTANKVQTQAKKEAFLAQIEVAQKELYKQIIEKENVDAASKAVAELFKDNDPATGVIKDEVTQTFIDAAKELVGFVTGKEKKAELLNQLNDAQNALNNKLSETETQAAAEKAVNELFTDNDPTTGTIKESVTQATIDAATALAGKVSNEAKNKELLASIQVAQTAFDKQSAESAAQAAAEKAVNELYVNDTAESNVLKDTTSQKELDAVNELIGKVTNIEKKEALQKLLADAQTLLDEQSNEMLVVDEFTLGKDSNVTGTLSKDITTIKLSVNGTEYAGGTISNGTFKFYAKGGKIKAVTDVVTIIGFNKAGERLITKVVKVVEAEAGVMSVADFNVGTSTNLTGTFSENIKSISVNVDGKVYKGGTLNSNGTFKFYFKGTVTNINQLAVISGFDKDGYEIARKKINLLPQTPGQGEIRPEPFVLTEDTSITGVYKYDVKSIEVFVDGVKYEGGTISGDGTFKFYARTIVTSINQKVEIIAYGVDGKETGRSFIPVITPEIGTGTLVADEFILGETKTITGTYTGDIASVRLLVDGVETKGGSVKKGLFTYYAAGKISKNSKDVKILGYDLRGNLLAEETIIVVDPNANPDPEVNPNPEETLPSEDLNTENE